MSSIDISTNEFSTAMEKKVRVVNETLRRIVSVRSDVNSDLKKAIEYTLNSPGKRIRPVLVLWACELVSGEVNENAKISAAAIEMVHTYSLVHDDLPAMDNDDFRRGRATCHKVFGEATAILTGDALLTLAFEILAEHIDDASMATKLISQLAQAAGPGGMIAGQIADLEAENVEATRQMLEYIHTNKTAKMFRCAAVLGAIAAKATDKEQESLADYGLKTGLGFQIADDILDVSASSEQLGKTAGKDMKAGKATYLSLFGMEKSKQLAQQFCGEAIDALSIFGRKADMLRQLAGFLLARVK